MIKPDITLAIAFEACKRARLVTPSRARELLQNIRLKNLQPLEISDALEYIGVKKESCNASLSETIGLIEKSESIGITSITYASDLYPELMRTIDDAPPIIYVRGSISSLSAGKSVSVVGSRKATPHGLEISRRLSRFLSENSYTVISGLALGIDAAAHEGALSGESPTIAVLAHGLEKAQPLANTQLADRIIENGGAWISEHIIGSKPRPEYFVLRNRLQVGLSRASVIVEGESNSGSRTQADFCLRNRRHLFAVLPLPGSKVRLLSELSEMLVEQRGATPIFSKEDYPELLRIISNWSFGKI